MTWPSHVNARLNLKHQDRDRDTDIDALRKLQVLGEVSCRDLLSLPIFRSLGRSMQSPISDAVKIFDLFKF